MKLIIALGAGLLTLGSAFILPGNAAAAEEPVTESTTVAKPSQAELRAAIERVKKIENYEAYSSYTAEQLAATTEFYREYTYLFELVAIAEALDANYDMIPAEELNRVILAAENAETTCGYLFGTIRKKNLVASETQAPDSSNNQTVSPAPVQTPVPITSSSKPQAQVATTIAVAAPTSIANDKPEQPAENTGENTETTETADAPIAVPATGEVEKSNKPFFITIGIVALACFFIGSMIILNRKKSYHPGRKF